MNDPIGRATTPGNSVSYAEETTRKPGYVKGPAARDVSDHCDIRVLVDEVADVRHLRLQIGSPDFAYSRHVVHRPARVFVRVQVEYRRYEAGEMTREVH